MAAEGDSHEGKDSGLTKNSQRSGRDPVGYDLYVRYQNRFPSNQEFCHKFIVIVYRDDNPSGRLFDILWHAENLADSRDPPFSIPQKQSHASETDVLVK